MKIWLSVFLFAHAALGHGGHEKGEGETIQEYAQRHMALEHHIDSFDLKSFFKLHDFDNDGYLDKGEIEAVYGVHHVYSQKKSKDEAAHQEKADHIVKTVLDLIDKSKDGKISIEEFEAAGLDALPNFDDLGAEGHHYDVESEFFLHHEEEFHSTPETQTDESYTHPEDIEHFGHHESIERKEAEREAKFQGISVEEALAAHDVPPPSENDAQQPLQAAHPHDDQVVPVPPVQPPNLKINRVTPPELQEPHVKYQGIAEEQARRDEWGTGQEGYKSPKSPSDKMRKNLPYKYKFRRNWGDF